ncbi:four helix bundle protein [Clostridium sporogenes]|uniref:four helix bundle protein n=1 Tax=unclassified Clostridium TaxID=2614128 RepID=UPI0013D3F7D0|nr:four helix bundle protein [Clostridium sporogenes]NFS26349.1 four helix bundle protein [Clostridium sporogenes]
MYSNIIVDKSFEFAVNIVRLYRMMINIKKEYVLSKQLLRSGTSIGANVKEGIKAISKADFRNKMSIALKEANETEYWLELMLESKILQKDDIKMILQDCKEICRILSSIVKTSSNNWQCTHNQ